MPLMESEDLGPCQQVPACFQLWTDLLPLDSQPSPHTHTHTHTHITHTHTHT